MRSTRCRDQERKRSLKTLSTDTSRASRPQVGKPAARAGVLQSITRSAAAVCLLAAGAAQAELAICTTPQRPDCPMALTAPAEQEFTFSRLIAPLAGRPIVPSLSHTSLPP